MKTAYLFPGLNGLLRDKDRKRFLGLSSVQSRFIEAQIAIKDELDIEIDLLSLLSCSTEEIYKLERIGIAAVAISSIQVGVVDHLNLNHSPPAFMVGVSLGDIARTVCAGPYDFRTAVVSHLRFSQRLEGIDKLGGNLGLATSIKAPFLESDFEWFHDQGIDVSVMTSRFLNIGALFSDIEKVKKKAKERGWKIMPIMDYPAHSRFIAPYVESCRDEFMQITLNAPKIPIFSTLSSKILTDPMTIKEEFLETVTKTVHFERAILDLFKNFGVAHFINIGPCKSLFTLLRDIDLPLKITDAEDMI